MFFFFNDTATTEIYTLSLHDALPIYGIDRSVPGMLPSKGTWVLTSAKSSRGIISRSSVGDTRVKDPPGTVIRSDRKSTRLNSSHANISYAVFCLKKKKQLIHLISSRL